jgi:hypothetical protein
MLFKAYPGTDIVKVIWMIPAQEMWGQFKKGLMTQNQTVIDSIEAYRHNRSRLEEKEEDDLTDSEIDAIYREIAEEARRKEHLKKSVQEVWRESNGSRTSTDP